MVYGTIDRSEGKKKEKIRIRKIKKAKKATYDTVNLNLRSQSSLTDKGGERSPVNKSESSLTKSKSMKKFKMKPTTKVITHAGSDDETGGKKKKRYKVKTEIR